MEGFCRNIIIEERESVFSGRKGEFDDAFGCVNENSIPDPSRILWLRRKEK